MMRALSIVQPRAQQQGVQHIPTRQYQQASTSTATAAASQQAASAAISVGATGPATAALAAALEQPQFSSGHGNRRSVILQSSSKDSSSPSIQSEVQKQQPSKSPKQCIPYAPSISMIAARLAGYQRATTARELQQQANVHTGEANGHSIEEAVSSNDNATAAACAPAIISQQGQDQAAATTMEYVVGNVPNPLRQQKQLEDHDQEEERMEVQQQQQQVAANSNKSNINNNNNIIDSINSSNIPNITTSRRLLSSIPPT